LGRPGGRPSRLPDITEKQLIDFVVREARLLDERRFEEWNALFTDDAFYWVPLTPGQPDGLDHTSHLYEDKLLRELRIERLKSPRAFSQQPPTRSLHLLQTPTVEPAPADADDAAEHLVRTVFQYTESQGDEMNTFVGVCWHRLVVGADGALRIRQKRVDLLNSDAALPAVQLFI
jgi:3-phenylpropionate/cinnamic acid dioxygenase small subunit